MFKIAVETSPKGIFLEKIFLEKDDEIIATYERFPDEDEYDFVWATKLELNHFGNLDWHKMIYGAKKDFQKIINKIGK